MSGEAYDKISTSQISPQMLLAAIVESLAPAGAGSYDAAQNSHIKDTRA
jgi:hypothetical protein